MIAVSTGFAGSFAEGSEAVSNSRTTLAIEAAGETLPTIGRASRRQFVSLLGALQGRFEHSSAASFCQQAPLMLLGDAL
jgi:hypothetical protein